MNVEERGDRSVIGKYEAIFSLFLGGVAYLWRDNPDLVYPNVLYLFLALMSLNLAAVLTMRRRPEQEWVGAVFALGNCGVIAALMEYSGGADSNLWVLFLLPIYTACLLLQPRAVVLITCGAIASNATFAAMRVELWGHGAIYILALKSGILALSAAMTGWLVQRERGSRAKLAQERVRLDSQQERLQAAEALAEVGLLSSGMAHDLNSAFAVIMGYLEITLKTEGLQPQVRHDIEKAVGSARLGRDIVAGFTAAAQSQRRPAAPTDVHLAVSRIAEMLRNEMRMRGITLALNLRAARFEIDGEGVQLQRVFMNLISNAVKAMPSGGALTVASRNVDDGAVSRLEVTVHDSGPGIPQSMLGRLFKPFATTRKEQGGTGLGLYICSEIVMRHGGSLRAENAPEGGARFTATFAGARRSAPGRDPLAIISSLSDEGTKAHRAPARPALSAGER